MRNGTISRRDVHALLDVVASAVATNEPTPFPAHVVEELMRLIGADRAGYVEYRVGDPPNLHDIELPRVDQGDLWQSVGHVIATWVLRDRLGRRRPAVRAVSDRLTRRERRENPFHRLVSEPLGVADELKIWLPAPDGEARLFWFCRDRTRRDFGARERELGRLIAPHFAQHRADWEARRRPAGLTEREAEILELVAQGLTNGEIADALTISGGTVRKHLENIYGKLGVHTRTAAAALLGR